MKFLVNWLPTKPSLLQLLDIAYIITILPLFLVIKLPMILFLTVVLILLLVKKKPTPMTLLSVFLLGAIGIFFSLYGSFNFSGLSRLRLFVELLIYLLFVAISLQRVTGKVNFYLKVSPVLLLALSLFFFHSIPMLIYIIIEVFVLLTLMLWQVMQTELKAVLHTASLLFTLSLPLVVLFFIFFPRISFKHATYGFKGEAIQRSGHDGLMHLDKNALLVPSKRIVMEVSFPKGIPPESNLYFRGSVLYTKTEKIWRPLPYPLLSEPTSHLQQTSLIEYKVTLYPTHKKWLYLLDQPYIFPKNTKTNINHETLVEKPIIDPLLYQASSILHPSYNESIMPIIRQSSLVYDKSYNPRSQHLIQTLSKKIQGQRKRLEAIKAFFRQQKLTYTFLPKPLDLDNSADSFLFDTKRGYCVHFADAFAILSRMAGIPARIVTGYKSDGQESVENYLVVRESDAHAWVEVYINGKWERVESTSLAAFVETEEQKEQTFDSVPETEKSQNKLESINLYLHYIKYQIDIWILEYSVLSQKRLFSSLRSDIVFLLKFVLSFILFALMILIGWYLWRQKQCKVPALCALQPLLKKLQKLGHVKHKEESLHTYFRRLDTKIDLDHIDRLYHRLRYDPSAQPDTLQQLKEEIRRLLRHL
jgi:transglutaminase-like putative cysteine protease